MLQCLCCESCLFCTSQVLPYCSFPLVLSVVICANQLLPCLTCLFWPLTQFMSKLDCKEPTPVRLQWASSLQCTTCTVVETLFFSSVSLQNHNCHRLLIPFDPVPSTCMFWRKWNSCGSVDTADCPLNAGSVC